jgi:hypothetical protein
VLRQRVRGLAPHLEWYWEDLGASNAVTHTDSRVEQSPVATPPRKFPSAPDIAHMPLDVTI